ncbi:ATP-NAD kinase-like domain-containing protein [Absidia repens]|uniref:diacylglycerol kinase (ATP) n=1 Tax=Absidia repens TaxID=90262 RepID=A0A1X2HZH2_9FUNG|nr:ATP-NAD kinase-like domain-containing protein [Absidia repens]
MPPLFQRRHTTGETQFSDCIIPDTTVEGRPSIYLFIFVNPLSGDQQGNDLIQLPVQQFRLRRRPQVKVEIHNILDTQDRQTGFEHILWIQNMIRQNQLPPLPTIDHGVNCHYHPQYKQQQKKIQGQCACFKTPTAMTRHIHVYSAGGDGTVMSVFDMLAQYKIDSNIFYFSCVPFGTGNDFSQVLGWGRTTKQTDILGSRLAHLESLLLERLDHGEAARLDIWQLIMTCHDSGYVRRAGIQKRHKKNNNDTTNSSSAWRSSVPSTDFDHYQRKSTNENPTSLERKMCSYVSIGVQGYVGSGFEQHRTSRRWANIWAYTIEGAKWLFYRKFPPITNFISQIVSYSPSIDENHNHDGDDGDSILLFFDGDNDFRAKNKKMHSTDSNTSASPSPPSPSPSLYSKSIPTITKQPIELVIQNIPHIWGRQIDLWGGAKSGLEIVQNRSGPTDATLWHPQRANDGHLELMAIGSMFSYIKKLANFRNHVSRVGQFGHPFKIEFKPPSPLSPSPPPPLSSSSSNEPKKFTNRYERDNIICIMCDGEFYEVKDPKEICLQRFDQIWTLGRSDENHQSRLVRDEMQYYQL